MTQKIQGYWKDTRLNYDNVVLSNLTMQSNYMEDVARGNCDRIADSDEGYKDRSDWNYWAAFYSILAEFNENCVAGCGVQIQIEREKMKGMLDAMNTIIEMMKKGEFIG